MNFSLSKTIKPIEEDFFSDITNKFNKFYLITNLLKVELQSVMFEVTYKKGSHILGAGAKQPILWVTLDGLLQEITVDKETFSTKTTWFWSGFSIVYAAPGFFDQEFSQVIINVVKDSRVAFISYEHWKKLKDKYEEFEKLTEVLRSDYERSRKQHLIDLSALTAIARCIKYELEIDLLLQHIKLKHVAEYLGMSTDTLGKIRRKLIKQTTF
jgi:hypothetical protein